MPIQPSTLVRMAQVAVLLFALHLSPPTRLANAQEPEPLPALKADKAEVARLRQKYADSQFSLKLPGGLTKVEQAGTPAHARAGIRISAWTPDGSLPSLKNLIVTLLPPTKPTSETLDDFVAGMKASMKKGLEDVELIENQRGTFNGVEVRYGEFRAAAPNGGANVYFLVGFDEFGTFSLTAMLPRADATQEEKQAFKNSLLTFVRVEQK